MAKSPNFVTDTLLPKPKKQSPSSLHDLLGIRDPESDVQSAIAPKQKTTPTEARQQIHRHVTGQEPTKLSGQAPGNQYKGKEGNPVEAGLVKHARDLEAQIHALGADDPSIPHWRGMLAQTYSALQNVRNGVKAVPHTEKERNLLPSTDEQISRERDAQNQKDQDAEKARQTGLGITGPKGYHDSEESRTGAFTAKDSEDALSKFGSMVGGDTTNLLRAGDEQFEKLPKPLQYLANPTSTALEAIAPGSRKELENVAGGFVGGPAQLAAGGLHDANAVMQGNPGEAAESLGQGAGKFGQSINIFEPGITPAQRVGRGAMLAATLYGGKELLSKPAKLLREKALRNLSPEDSVAVQEAHENGTAPQLDSTDSGVKMNGAMPSHVEKMNPLDIGYRPDLRVARNGPKMKGEFHPSRSGPLLVYEDNAGHRYIVDGARRLSQARASGKDVPVHILKESDVVTPDEAKAAGLMRNSMSGTSTPEMEAELERMGRAKEPLNTADPSHIDRTSGSRSGNDTQTGASPNQPPAAAASSIPPPTLPSAAPEPTANPTSSPTTPVEAGTSGNTAGGQATSATSPQPMPDTPASEPTPASPEPITTNPSSVSSPVVYRTEEPGVATTSPESKPHGLYLATEKEGLGSDLGGKQTAYRWHPKNPLKFQWDDWDNVFGRSAPGGGKVPLSVGVRAAKHILGDGEFNRLKDMGGANLKRHLKDSYPNVDWDKFYDNYERIEALAGIEGRKSGYDGFESKDEDVALKNSAISNATNPSSVSPSESTPPSEPPEGAPKTRGDARIAEATARRNARIASERKLGKQSGVINITKDDLHDLGEIILGHIENGADHLTAAMRKAADTAREWFPQATPKEIKDAVVNAVKSHPDLKEAVEAERARVAQSEKGDSGTTGIAHRINEAQKETFGEVPRGKGVSEQETLKHGREAIASGTDPEKELSDFEKTGNLSHQRMGVLRAHEEALSKAYRAAAGTPEESAAKQAVTDWRLRMKPAGTEAGDILRSMKGETDLDTGDWRSLATEFGSNTKGREPLTPKEVSEAKGFADQTKKIDAEHENLEKKMADVINGRTKANAPKGDTITVSPRTPKTSIKAFIGASTKAEPKTVKILEFKDLAEQIGKQIKSKELFMPEVMRSKQAGAVNVGQEPHFTAQQRASLWKHIKDQYVDPAATTRKNISLDDLANKVSEDFRRHGVDFKKEWVKDIVAGRKTAERELDNEMLRLQQRRAQVQQEARIWAKAGRNGALRNAMMGLYGIQRSAKISIHGAAFPVTHIATSNFDPMALGDGAKAFVNAWTKSKPENIESAMTRMEAKDNYPLKVKTGLRVKRGFEDDYQNYYGPMEKAGKALHKVGAPVRKLAEIGHRQMEYLKIYRDERWDQIWDQVTKKKPIQDYIKTRAGLEDLATQISDQANHESGTRSTNSNSNFGSAEKVVQGAMFGPNLFRTRFARILGDPYKTVRDLSDKNATPAQKALAQYRLKRFARQLTAYVGVTLGSNWALMRALGKKDEDNVNFTDPSKSDWLLPKDLGGTAYDASGGMISLGRHLINIGEDAVGLKDAKSRMGRSRLQDAEIEASDMLVNSLHPAFQPIADKMRGYTYAGGERTMMPGEANPHHKPQLSPLQYFGKQAVPIPAEGAVTEMFSKAFQKEGWSASSALRMAKSIFVGLSGAREVIPRPLSPEEQKKLREKKI